MYVVANVGTIYWDDDDTHLSYFLLQPNYYYCQHKTKWFLSKVCRAYYLESGTDEIPMPGRPGARIVGRDC